ncbi:hypothetical protein RHSIM_Rhsim10G0029100 [Rhododendron simsii]|uniref:Uncharacterized protein n=1 Tax=Rhododendron simsii TaxID=118357 RepID=A0A834LBP2_RHOSS|nr:hypothetical protein RHSIM_Rhsim10G0029100 [Rhododendron simsii]
MQIEESYTERRIVGLKKRIQELWSEFELANAELEDAKSLKENMEQEIKGYEVELAMNEASIQTLEARVALFQEEISVAGSGLEALKLYRVNGDYVPSLFLTLLPASVNLMWKKFSSMDFLRSKGKDLCDAEDAEVSRRALENQIAKLVSQTNFEEQECQAELNACNQFLLKIVYTNYKLTSLKLVQVQLELIDMERKVFLMEAIMKESILVQSWKKRIASLGEELQKRCLCPSCGIDNVEALGGILQACDGS